jgi:hypothetical protein
MFIREHKKLFWEINFWAWLEANTDWKTDWYFGKHNDKIINIPTKYYASLLHDKLERTVYDYPKIWNFFPSSASYLNHNGEHILNTRYVNYSFYLNGYYDIKHPENTIITRNMLSILNDHLIPISYNEMNEYNIGLKSYDLYSIGLEDIRLYSYKDNIKFIATNVNYVGDIANRMIIGDYDIKSCLFLNSKIIQPPTQTPCEKNWIPLNNGEEECFIYKWSPFEIGKINHDTNHLEIIKSYEIKSPDFHRIRGSTIFIDNINQKDLIGLVHFSEETSPRQYYHMLVTLDKETKLPISYSDPFCFQHYGVEFCIGFTIKNNKYVFWISKKDNDAIMVSIDINEIPIRHNVLICNSN